MTETGIAPIPRDAVSGHFFFSVSELVWDFVLRSSDFPRHPVFRFSRAAGAGRRAARRIYR